MTLDLTLSRERGKEKVTVRVEPNDSIEETLDDISSYWNISGSLELEGRQGKIDTDLLWQDSEVEDGETLSIKTSFSPKTLPVEIWKTRIDNELSELEENGYKFKKHMEKDSVVIDVHLQDVSGPVKVDERIGLVFSHSLKIKLSRSYPSESPTIRWQTSVFHPNIAPPENEGMMHSSIIENWNLENDLLDLLQHLEDLLTDPELDYTLEITECQEAAEEYRENGFPGRKG